MKRPDGRRDKTMCTLIFQLRKDTSCLILRIRKFKGVSDTIGIQNAILFLLLYTKEHLFLLSDVFPARTAAILAIKIGHGIYRGGF